jgi:O-antigen/teichoic acid export membrane protein
MFGPRSLEIRDSLSAVATTASSPRTIYWVKTLSKFTTAQLVLQAIGVASGILLVRTLEQREYAYLTIAFAMQSTMNILADSGVSIGLSSIGGRVWQDPHRFGQLINTALRLRKYLASVTIVVVAPILLWLLRRNGASFEYAGVLTLLVLAGVGLQLTTVVLMVVPRLHSQINRVQIIELTGAVARLALISVAYFVFLNAATATVATVLSIVAQYLLLKRWTSDSIENGAGESREDRKEIISIVKSQLPNSIFFCLQGQVMVWLVAIFGSAKSVAEIGALGRLGVLFGVIGAVMTSIVLPSFARCQSPSQLRSRYLQIVGAFLLFGATLVGAAWLFPDQVLWILGSKYAHLRDSLFLMVVLSAFNALIAAMWSLNSTKAWIKRSWLNIPLTIASQILLLLVIDISTLEGVLLFGVLSLLPAFALNVGLGYSGLHRRNAITDRSAVIS